MAFEPSNPSHYAGLERTSIGAQTLLRSYPPHTSSYGNPIVGAAIAGVTAIAGGVIGTVQSNKANKAQQQMLQTQINAESLYNQTLLQIEEKKAQAAASLAQQQTIMYVVGGVSFISLIGLVAYYIKTQDD